MDTLDLESQYILSLSQKEHKSFLIAKSHLGSSFEICKSIGFIQWKKNHKAVSELIESKLSE